MLMERELDRSYFKGNKQKQYIHIQKIHKYIYIYTQITHIHVVYPKKCNKCKKCRQNATNTAKGGDNPPEESLLHVQPRPPTPIFNRVLSTTVFIPGGGGEVCRPCVLTADPCSFHCIGIYVCGVFGVGGRKL